MNTIPAHYHPPGQGGELDHRQNPARPKTIASNNFSGDDTEVVVADFAESCIFLVNFLNHRVTAALPSPDLDSLICRRCHISCLYITERILQILDRSGEALAAFAELPLTTHIYSAVAVWRGAFVQSQTFTTQ